MNTATNIPFTIKTSKSPRMVVLKSDLVKFYEGWHHYWTMEREEGCIIFKLPSCNLVEGAKLEAQKRIDDLDLNLEVVGTGRMSNTFVVKVKGGVE